MWCKAASMEIDNNHKNETISGDFYISAGYYFNFVGNLHIIVRNGSTSLFVENASGIFWTTASGNLKSEDFKLCVSSTTSSTYTVELWINCKHSYLEYIVELRAEYNNYWDGIHSWTLYNQSISSTQSLPNYPLIMDSKVEEFTTGKFFVVSQDDGTAIAVKNLKAQYNSSIAHFTDLLFQDKDDKSISWIRSGLNSENSSYLGVFGTRGKEGGTVGETDGYQVLYTSYLPPTTNSVPTFHVAHIYPKTNNANTLGKADMKWKELYAGTGTINTSDERLKDDINSYQDNLLDAWAEVNPVQFKFKDAIQEKGSVNARIHSGMIAQQIKEVFERHNIDPTRYAFFCYNSWEAKPAQTSIVGEKYDEFGNVIPGTGEEINLINAIEAGDVYSLRYEEALCIEAAYLRRENQRLKNEINEMKERLSQLEEKLS